MANTSNLSGDAIDAIRPDLEAFASLWTSLRVTYEGTNITKTIARLLHMYQPEDGIQAYERLLKTLFVLLEDFDGNGLRLLVSMVPPPKGSSDETIKDVFFKATGFVRIDAPIFHQNYPLLSSVTNHMDSEINKGINCENNSLRQSIRENIINDKKKSHLNDASTSRSDTPQMLSQDYYSFRGFPPTDNYLQTQNSQRHDSGQYFMSADHCESSANLSLNKFKMNWLQGAYCMQNGNVRQSNSCYRDMLVKTMDNKYLRVPIAHCNSNLHYYNSPYQITPAERKVQSNSKHTITSGFLTNSSPNQIANTSNVKQEEKDRNNEIRNSQINSDLSEHNYNLIKNSDEKSNEIDEKQCQDIIRNEIYKIDVVNCENYGPISLEDCIIENLTVSHNLAESVKSFLKRAQDDESSSVNGDITEMEKKSADDNSNKNPRRKKHSQLQTQKSSEKNTTHNIKETKNCPNETNDSSYNFIYQTNSMSELAAYKRQYYDALLNIQRAKMAVANSLILSPMQRRSDYDPYHPDNLQQPRWIFQQPQRLIVGPSYAQRYGQPEYSSIHNTCVRPNDWMSNYPSSRVAQETPMMHNSYDSRVLYSNHELTSQMNDCVPNDTKLEAKKRKLENIVVKLKENEMNSIHN
ncbi:hypothetical protein PV325_005424 [Microctonus aethiopoides]|uniref:Uncharacterized protein n=1 Tax=Microctonus aethiopoides TaxID=144406 RepID=A0AA39FPQ8_9HYME|nr:hypothetical protein PV325_005424 [Microctonus aethiopoides]KAK0173134.1 hypothetical protein PV328_006377 [Microctonus aethiopoides]